jgi:hypothetical protein
MKLSFVYCNSLLNSFLKRQWHEMNIFLEGPKNQNSTFWMNVAYGFDIFYCLFRLPWNHLLNVKILPVTRFTGLVPAFRSRLWTSKNCSESRPWMYTREIQPMRVKKRRNRNLMRLTEQSLELGSVFKEESRNFTFIFLFNKPG